MLAHGFYTIEQVTVTPGVGSLALAGKNIVTTGEGDVAVLVGAMTLAGTTPTISDAGVALSGEAITANDNMGSVTAGIRVNSDGTIDKNVKLVYTQIDAATDWIIPNGSAPDDYEVRVAAPPPGDAFSASPGTDGDWFALTSNREWSVLDSNSGPTNKATGNFLLEIRKGASGDALVSGTYSLTAQYLI